MARAALTGLIVGIRAITTGKARYLKATRLMITAGAGGFNSYCSRAFTVELAKLAVTIGLIITICHMPLEISNWNEIDHVVLLSYPAARKPLPMGLQHKVSKFL